MPENGPVTWGSVLPVFIVLPISVAPTLLSGAGPLYQLGVLLLASGFLYCAVQLALHRSNAVAKRLLFASILYLPIAFVLMMICKP